MNIIERPEKDKMLQDILDLFYRYYKNPSKTCELVNGISETELCSRFTEGQEEKLYVFWRENFCTDDDIIMPDEIDRLIELINKFPIEL
jgi:hypothetical protein